MARQQITSSSTAEYFAKNLQQVGFSSPTKAVLTTLKEAVDNSLDACEEAGIIPEISVEIEKIGSGSQKNTDKIQLIVHDNGPGIEAEDLARVYGEYLASSKFGRGRCSRGQQGIGISAATTWAQLTNAAGVTVISKTAKMRKAILVQIDVDIKKNQGVLKKKETIDWDREHGVKVEFRLDGRIQLHGDGGLLTYLEGTTLVNPHLTLHYKFPGLEWVDIPRVADNVPEIPSATDPHPHTMKLGELITHAHLFGKISFSKFLRQGFSRVSDANIQEFVKKGLSKKILEKSVAAVTEEEFKNAYQAIQNTELMAPSTRSVLTIGEESLSKSIQRLGQVDFFSVVTRKPRICDFKPVVVEVAIARFLNRGGEDEPCQLLRFANRVPLQFDKAACAVTQAVQSVNWRSYGLNQPKDSLPLGPYVFAVSVVSPFIKFKNASKETIDASDELVEEIRRALMQAGQKLSRHIRKENREADLERKLQHIEQFGPILVEGLIHILEANDKRRKAAEAGLRQILGRDAVEAEKELAVADEELAKLKARQKAKGVGIEDETSEPETVEVEEGEEPIQESEEAVSEKKGTKKSSGKAPRGKK